MHAAHARPTPQARRARPRGRPQPAPWRPGSVVRLPSRPRAASLLTRVRPRRPRLSSSLHRAMATGVQGPGVVASVPHGCATHTRAHTRTRAHTHWRSRSHTQTRVLGRTSRPAHAAPSPVNCTEYVALAYLLSAFTSEATPHPPYTRGAHTDTRKECVCVRRARFPPSQARAHPHTLGTHAHVAHFTAPRPFPAPDWAREEGRWCVCVCVRACACTCAGVVAGHSAAAAACAPGVAPTSEPRALAAEGVCLGAVGTRGGMPWEAGEDVRTTDGERRCVCTRV